MKVLRAMVWAHNHEPNGLYVYVCVRESVRAVVFD